jgi:hypothetical protein
MDDAQDDLEGMFADRIGANGPDQSTVAAPAKPKSGTYGYVDFAWMRAARKAAGRSMDALMVAIWLQAQHRMKRGGAFPVANAKLAKDTGVSRFSKYKALSTYERARLIRLKRRGRGQAPIVTVLPPFH